MIGRTGATITSFFPSRAGSSTEPAAERSAARVLKFGSARAVATSCKPIEGEEKVRGTSGNGLQAEVVKRTGHVVAIPLTRSPTVAALAPLTTVRK